MLSWRRNESLAPSAASVISAKIGCRARLTRCDLAVHRWTCQRLVAFGRHPISHSPPCPPLQLDPVIPWFEVLQQRLPRFPYGERGSIVGLVLALGSSTGRRGPRRDAREQPPLRPRAGRDSHRAGPARAMLADSES